MLGLTSIARAKASAWAPVSKVAPRCLAIAATTSAIIRRSVSVSFFDISSVHPLALRRYHARELGDGFKDALPYRAAFGIDRGQ
jgi:hypothetical protein